MMHDVTTAIHNSVLISDSSVGSGSSAVCGSSVVSGSSGVSGCSVVSGSSGVSGSTTSKLKLAFIGRFLIII